MDNNSNFLIILVGLPASGKSTFASQLKAILESNLKKKVKIIDPDIIRNKTFPDRFDFRNEPQIREKSLKSVRKHLINGHTVISDDLNYYSSMRHDLKFVAESLNINYYIIHISTPLKLCLKRNEERGKPIPNKVIKNIYNKFDDFNKYKWDRPFETYDITQTKNATQFIENLTKNITLNLQEKRKSKEDLQIKPYPSFREDLDLITRKAVGKLLKKPEYHLFKKAILEYRKSFIKSKADEEFDVNRILEDFKLFLDEKLKL